LPAGRLVAKEGRETGEPQEGAPADAGAQIGMMRMGGRRHSGWRGHGPMPEDYYQSLMNAVEAFKWDGVISPLHRAGIGCLLSMKAAAMKLMERRVPVMHYET
jgi:hypothetical protein